jgi:hypothetical protein
LTVHPVTHGEMRVRVQQSYPIGLRALLALNDIELDCLTVFERLVSVDLDRGVVDENVLPRELSVGVRKQLTITDGANELLPVTRKPRRSRKSLLVPDRDSSRCLGRSRYGQLERRGSHATSLAGRAAKLALTCIRVRSDRMSATAKYLRVVDKSEWPNHF